MNEIQRSSIAALVHADHGTADGLLADFAFALRAAGWRVSGLVQQFRGGTDKNAIVLVDLDEGTSFQLFQDLGPGAGSCSIDLGSLAAAGRVLRDALGRRPDLVIVNRFGALEAAGKGFADEMLALMSEGIPVLTVVSEPYRFDWRHFTGGLGAELEASADALERWFARLTSKEVSHETP